MPSASNPLQFSTPPEAPEPGAGDINQLASQPPQPSAKAPAPTHAQTMAALRHFSEMAKAFEPLVKSPELGKADMKSQIIDAVTKLVSERMVTPADAVKQLSTVPEKPQDQRKWVTKLYVDNQLAPAVVLEQHRRGLGGQEPNPDDAYNMDNHIEHMNGMMGQYRNG